VVGELPLGIAIEQMQGRVDVVKLAGSQQALRERLPRGVDEDMQLKACSRHAQPVAVAHRDRSRDPGEFGSHAARNLELIAVAKRRFQPLPRPPWGKRRVGE
jgi:hypothetical protein